MQQFSKLDDNTLQITDDVVIKPAVSTYLYNDLIAMRDSLVNQKSSFDKIQDGKIASAQALVDAADSLGIVATKEE